MAIQYDNIPNGRSAKGYSGLLTNSDNVSNKRYSYDNTSASVVTALDIDWCGAVLPNADLATGNNITINTTGDLLNLVTEMQQEIYVLSAAICALSGN